MDELWATLIWPVLWTAIKIVLIVGPLMLAIAYLTFVIAWMKGRGSSALELSLVWAVVGIGIMVGPFLWARPLRDWRGGAPQAAAIAVLALGAALPLVSGTLAATAVSARRPRLNRADSICRRPFGQAPLPATVSTA